MLRAEPFLDVIVSDALTVTDQQQCSLSDSQIFAHLQMLQTRKYGL